MKLRFAALFVGLFASAGASGSQTPAHLTVAGDVYYADGAGPAPGARVIFFELADLRHSASAVTDAQGRFTVMVPAAGTEASVPRTFRLLQNYPNPFNPGTVIPYYLEAAGQVRLEVFNLLGQRVRLLVDGAQPGGSHAATWDATDDRGRLVGAGVYLYRLTVDGMSDARQMLLADGPVGPVPAGGPLAVAAPAPPAAPGGPARAYGLTISGAGIFTYVQPEILVQEGMGRLTFAVGGWRAGSAPRRPRCPARSWAT